MDNQKVWEGLKAQLDDMKEETLSFLLKSDSEYLQACMMRGKAEEC